MTIPSLWGHLKMGEMGSSLKDGQSGGGDRNNATNTKSTIKTLPKVLGLRENKKKISLSKTTQLLSTTAKTSYTPKSTTTLQAYNILLSFTQETLLMNQQTPSITETVDEILKILNAKEKSESDMKRDIQDVLALSLGMLQSQITPVSSDSLSQLLTLSSHLTDYTLKEIVAKEGEDVTVVFGDDSSSSDSSSDDGCDDGDGDDDGDDILISLVKKNTAMAAAMTSTTLPTLPLNTTRIQKPKWEEIRCPPPGPPPPSEKQLLRIADAIPPKRHSAFAGQLTLNTIQTEVYDSAFLSDHNMLVCAPTGAGKTNIALLTIIKALEDGNGKDAVKIVYIAPMKALVQEILDSFCKKLSDLKIIELTGDSQTRTKELKEATIVISTPEKWDVVTRRCSNATNNASNSIYNPLVDVDLIIFDEIHLLADERGPVLESLIARHLEDCDDDYDSSSSLFKNTGDMNSRKKKKKTRLVGLSATLPNYADVATLIEAERVHYFEPKYRPCPLKMEFIGYQEGRPLQSARLLNEIVVEKLLERRNEQIIVFVHSRKDCLSTAEFCKESLLAKGVVFGAGIETADSDSVHNTIEAFGLGIHHAGLTKENRKRTEAAFREGRIMVLFSTATLAWGVNMPCHTVIIKGTQIYRPEKGGWTPLTGQDLHQMIGRAGRPQYDKEGEGIVITDRQSLPHYLSLLSNQTPIESQLMVNVSSGVSSVGGISSISNVNGHHHKPYCRLLDILNAEIAIGRIWDRASAVSFLGRTFWIIRAIQNPALYGIDDGFDGGFDVESGSDDGDGSNNSNNNCNNNSKIDPTLLLLRTKIIDRSFERLKNLSMIQYSNSCSHLVLPTPLGRLASSFYLSHPTVEAWSSIISNNSSKNNKNGAFPPHSTPPMWSLLPLVGVAHEFCSLSSRRGEERQELLRLQDLIPLPLPSRLSTATTTAVSGDEEFRKAKISILLQAYIGRLELNSPSLRADSSFIVANAGRICRALEAFIRVVCTTNHGTTVSLLKDATRLALSVERRQWSIECPLRQLKSSTVNPRIIRRLERKDFPFRALLLLPPHSLAELVGGGGGGAAEDGRALHALLKDFPMPQSVDVSSISMDSGQRLLRICLQAKVQGAAAMASKYTLLLSSSSSLKKEVPLCPPIVVDFSKSPTATAIISLKIPLQPKEDLGPFLMVSLLSTTHIGSVLEKPLPLAGLTRPEGRQRLMDIAAIEDLEGPLYRSSGDVIISGANGANGGRPAFALNAGLAIKRCFVEIPSGATVVCLSDSFSALQNLHQEFKHAYKDFSPSSPSISIHLLRGEGIEDSIAAMNENVNGNRIILSTFEFWNRIEDRKEQKRVNLMISCFTRSFSADPSAEQCLMAALHAKSKTKTKTKRMVYLFAYVLENVRPFAEWVGVDDRSTFLLCGNFGGYNSSNGENGGNNSNATSSNANQHQQHHQIPTVDLIDQEIPLASLKHMKDVCFVCKDHSFTHYRAILPTSQRLLSISSLLGRRDCQQLQLEKHYLCLDDLLSFEELSLLFYSCTERLTLTKIDSASQPLLRSFFGEAAGDVRIVCESGLLGAVDSFSSVASLIFVDLQRGKPSCFTNLINRLWRGDSEAAGLWRKISSSFFYQRLLLREGAEGAGAKLSSLIKDSLAELESAEFISLNGDAGDGAGDDGSAVAEPSSLIARHYSLSWETIEMFNLSLGPKSRRKQMVECCCSMDEVLLIVPHLAQLSFTALHQTLLRYNTTLVPRLETDSVVCLAKILLYSYLYRISDPLVDCYGSLLVKTLWIPRGLPAIVDIMSSSSWVRGAIAGMELCQSMTQRIGDGMSEVMQLPHLTFEVLQRFKEGGSGDDNITVYDVDSTLLDCILSPKDRKDAIEAANSYPCLDVSVVRRRSGFNNNGSVEPNENNNIDNENINNNEEELVVTLKHQRDVDVRDTVTTFEGVEEIRRYGCWLLVVKDTEGAAAAGGNGEILSIKRVFAISDGPISLPVDGCGGCQLSLYVVSDAYKGLDQVIKV